MSQKVESWTYYNEWGEITHDAVLKCGQRELDLVKNYTGHDFDSVLSQYYAKARMYDAGDRRFTSVDPVKGFVMDPVSLIPYLYVKNAPLVYVDPLGQYLIQATVNKDGKVSYTLVQEDTNTALKDATLKEFLPVFGDLLVIGKQSSSHYVGGSGHNEYGFTELGGLVKDSADGLESAERAIIDIVNPSHTGPKTVSEAVKSTVAESSWGSKILKNIPVEQFAEKAGSVAGVIGIFMIVKNYGDTGNRLEEDQVIFDVLDILEKETGKNYRTSDSYVQLQGMMDELIEYVRGGSGAFAIDKTFENISKGKLAPHDGLYDKPYQGRTNYYYFFVCMIRDQYGEGSRSWTTHIGLTSLKQWNVDLEAYRAGNPDSYESYRQSLLAQYNKIKSNKHLTSFTDWKNTPLTKARFENMIGYRNAYSRAEHYISEMKSIVDKYWN